MDRKQLLATLVALIVTLMVLPSAFAAPALPFTVTRDGGGKLVSIELPSRKSRNGEVDLLAVLRAAMNERNGIMGLQDELSSLGLKKKEELDAFEKAKRYLTAKISKADLEDPRLDVEFAKAKVKLDDLFVYRLLANPYDPSAFDKENLVTEAVKQIIDAAGLVFTMTPPMKIFEFLVDQHLEALEARREFHQNRLLLLIDDPQSEFRPYEKSLIRSSVYYSRLWIVNPIARKSARRSWETYGDKQYRADMKKCEGFVSKTDTAYGPCFKNAGTQIRNRLVAASLISNSTSLAYDFNSPTRVRNIRIAWMLSRLGLKFVPAPGIVKDGVTRWIKSNYSGQRRSEGFAFEAARAQGKDDLAHWIAIGNANPLLNP